MAEAVRRNKEVVQMGGLLLPDLIGEKDAILYNEIEHSRLFPVSHLQTRH